jgi:predicted enzyme related to lactoylglutathione lyase
MPTIIDHAPGAPCWVELSTTDVESATKFYGEVIGWTDFEVAGEEMGFYTIPKVDGANVAGMATQQDIEKQIDVPPHWNTYISVTSADESASKAKELGATVVVEPFDVMDLGRMAVLIDPAGAAISLWEPKLSPGAGVMREVGAVAWNELDVQDAESAKTFYTSLFGWTVNEHKEPVHYTEWLLDDQAVGGMLTITPDMGEIPPNWQVFFEVPDTDAAVAKAKGAGGQVFVEPMDVPAGRFAVIADPQGAVFSVIKSAPR